MLIPAGRPARHANELRPAGRPAGRSLGFGRPSGRPPGYLCIGVVSGGLAVWLCLPVAKVLAGRPADGWLYLQLAKVLAGRPAGWLLG